MVDPIKVNHFIGTAEAYKDSKGKENKQRIKIEGLTDRFNFALENWFDKALRKLGLSYEVKILTTEKGVSKEEYFNPESVRKRLGMGKTEFKQYAKTHKGDFTELVHQKISEATLPQPAKTPDQQPPAPNPVKEEPKPDTQKPAQTSGKSTYSKRNINAPIESAPSPQIKPAVYKNVIPKEKVADLIIGRLSENPGKVKAGDRVIVQRGNGMFQYGKYEAPSSKKDYHDIAIDGEDGTGKHATVIYLLKPAANPMHSVTAPHTKLPAHLRDPRIGKTIAKNKEDQLRKVDQMTRGPITKNEVQIPINQIVIVKRSDEEFYYGVYEGPYTEGTYDDYYLINFDNVSRATPFSNIYPIKDQPVVKPAGTQMAIQGFDLTVDPSVKDFTKGETVVIKSGKKRAAYSLGYFIGKAKNGDIYVDMGPRKVAERYDSDEIDSEEDAVPDLELARVAIYKPKDNVLKIIASKNPLKLDFETEATLEVPKDDGKTKKDTGTKVRFNEKVEVEEAAEPENPVRREMPGQRSFDAIKQLKPPGKDKGSDK